LYRIVLPDDFTEIASGSPLHRSNRLYSTVASAVLSARPLTPSRIGSPPFAPPYVWSRK
jgi:hypothetical protein